MLGFTLEPLDVGQPRTGGAMGPSMRVRRQCRCGCEMTNLSNSTFGWLDSSEHERRAVLELVSALNEPGTLDELGIGSIRDTIADTLFPGTSTIQTRARYFLFIPWILQMVEASSARSAEERARQLQLQLCDALDKAHGPNAGVIGREARNTLQRWPLSIYWLGLARWGIRRRSGSLASYFATIRQPSSWLLSGRALEEQQVEGRRDEAADGVRGNWADVPKPPQGFPESATFELTAEEGDFLRERVALTHPQTYLAHILQTNEDGESSLAISPWDHSAAQTAPASVRAWLHDARLFSLVHQGGTLLYDLMLAEALEDEESIDEFSEDLGVWSEWMAEAEPDLQRWDRTAMWQRLRSENPRLRRRTEEFADRWYILAATQPGSSLMGKREARDLIRQREHALKGPRARLTYAEARDRRRGYPTPARLQFRWPQVQRIADDILNPLGDPDA